MIISFDKSEVQPIEEKIEDNIKMNEEIITITEGYYHFKIDKINYYFVNLFLI